MTLQRQVQFWLAVALVFGGFLWLLHGMLLPFVAGMALAYFLDPVADRLERAGLSRLVATIVILVAFVLLFVVLGITVVPMLGDQFVAFIERMPGYAQRLQVLVNELSQGWLGQLVGDRFPEIQRSLGDLMGQASRWLGTFLTSLWSGGQAIVSVVSLLVLTPVIAFYLLYDWDRMVETVDSWLPRDHVETLRELAADMNDAIAGFVRGQALVGIILGTAYGLALTAAGLNFGLLIGFVTGLLSFIPFVGSLIGLLLSVGVALVQFWPDWIMVLVVIAIFAAGQFVEGNFLQPKLVGDAVGLHPVWLMFSLFAFGYLFGFVGLLIAVPVAAAIGVLTRFALGQYMASPMYRGVAGREGTRPPGA
jgi:predicted PurR-regulated permease PerM